MANLLLVLDDLPGWEAQMTAELQHARFAGAWVRIHDAGDFYSDDYLAAWLRIIQATPGTRFYCYTKEVERFRRMVEPLGLPNFGYVYSYGGRQDGSITEHDRRCDVFPSDEALEAAGFHDQAESDLLAVTGPPEVGIVVNNHRGAARAMRGLSMRALQAARHERHVDAAG
jgi:hypothetical protein